MKLLFSIISISILVAATGVDAQSCARITSEDLGDSDMTSTSGLIAARLAQDSGDTPPLVQLLGFKVVCEAVSVDRGTFRGVSLVANYTQNGATIMSQFEFGCAGTPISSWVIEVGGNVENTVTTPPDATMETTLDTSCANCVGPRRGIMSTSDTHCEECSGSCTGLDFCTSSFFFGCCNYYFDDACTRSCPAPTVPHPDNICRCPIGFTGGSCDIPVCEPNPCNSFTCTSLGNTFSCVCPPDFTGDTCEIFVDPCNENPCMNAGTCLRITSTDFSCECPMGFEGQLCQSDTNECEISQDLCSNGGTCENTVGGYICLCGMNWEGPSCDVCGISNCLTCTGNDAICTNCEEQYAINVDRTCTLITVCTPSCVNGVCIRETCICETGFVGNTCSETCSSVIPNCLGCRVESNVTVCVVCDSGYSIVDNQCNAPCEVSFCSECTTGGIICQRCNNFYSLNEANNICIRIDPSPIRLTDIEIIAIIVGSCIGLILIASLSLCCVVFICKKRNGRGSRRKARTHQARVNQDALNMDESGEEEKNITSSTH